MDKETRGLIGHPPERGKMREVVEQTNKLYKNLLLNK